MRTNATQHGSLGVTHEGAPARTLTALQELRRTVLSCFLWEDAFYESGTSIAERIAELVPRVQPEQVAALAVEAREQMKLRHAPLLLVKEMSEHTAHRKLVRSTLSRIVQRADELSEFLSLYWQKGKRPLAKSVQRGLADAFVKFNEYQLAKYNRDSPIKLRDVLFLTHPKPKNAEQEALWKHLADKTLTSPDTWEVSLSAGKDKKETWTRLLWEKKLGGLALLRNLRNMEQVGVDPGLIRDALKAMKTERILPFRFVSAAKASPKFEPELDQVMLRCCAEIPKLPGTTVLVVDVSGSMYGGVLSKHSTLDRAYVACTLASLTREIAEHSDIYATAGSDYTRTHQTERVPARRGMALVDAVYNLTRPLGGGGIFLSQCLEHIWTDRNGVMADRVIVITDEQDCETDPAKSPLHARQIAKRQYLINVSVEKPGIGYGPWTHIDGWSERVLDYIREVENVA